MTAGGGLLQLVATGKQDMFLTGNPQLSFFKMVFRRHTNFASECQPMYFDGNPTFGQRITCIVPRRGDLLGRISLDVTLPTLRDTSGNTLSYTNSVGHALIQEITLEINEQQIDRQTGEWMEVWTQLTTPDSQRNALNEMIGRFEPYNLIGITPGAATTGLRLLIPLHFYFCRHPGMYLPLIAMQYSQIRITITLRPVQQLFWVTPPAGAIAQANWMPTCSVQVDQTAQIVNMMMWGEYIYLDVEERRKFVTTNHEYLIEQVQYTPPYSVTARQTTATVPVDFNQPVKEFIFMVQRESMIYRNEWFNYSNLAIGEPTPEVLLPYVPSNAAAGRLDMITEAKLLLDGYDRFPARPPNYFRLQQPFEHHTATPVNSYLYNYCFALRPEEAQPTGTMNASRIDSIVWQIELNPVLLLPTLPSWQQRGSCRIMVYGQNYNVLRVIGGFAGLLFKI